MSILYREAEPCAFLVRFFKMNVNYFILMTCAARSHHMQGRRSAESSKAPMYTVRSCLPYVCPDPMIVVFDYQIRLVTQWEYTKELEIVLNCPQRGQVEGQKVNMLLRNG